MVAALPSIYEVPEASFTLGFWIPWGKNCFQQILVSVGFPSFPKGRPDAVRFEGLWKYPTSQNYILFSVTGSSVWGVLLLQLSAWQPTSVFLPGDSQRQRSLEHYSLWGCKESDTTEVTEHTHTWTFWYLVSVQFSSVMSDSLQPHESQHARPPCPSPTPRVHSNSCPSSRWYHSAISSSVILFSSCPQSLPASGSFPMSQLFSWGDQYWVSNMVLALGSKLLSGKELNQIIKKWIFSAFRWKVLRSVLFQWTHRSVFRYVFRTIFFLFT